MPNAAAHDRAVADIADVRTKVHTEDLARVTGELGRAVVAKA